MPVAAALPRPGPYTGLTPTAGHHGVAATQPTTGGGWVGTARRRKTENDEALLLLGLV